MRKLLSILCLLAVVSAFAGRNLGGGGMTDFWFETGFQSTPRLTVSGTASPATILDQVFSTVAGGTFQNDRLISVVITANKAHTAPVGAPSYTSSNTAVATVATTGVVTHVNGSGTGSSNITVTYNGVSRAYPVNFAVLGSTQTINSFTRYCSTNSGDAKNSLAAHCQSQVDTLIASAIATAIAQSKSPQLSIPMYSTSVTGTPSSYTRNTTCWLGAVDSTCINAWASLAVGYYSAGGCRYGYTLVTKRHVISAQHVGAVPGETLKFVNNSNQVFTYTIMASIQTSVPDVLVSILDRDVDASLTPCAVLPESSMTLGTCYFPSLIGNYSLSFMPGNYIPGSVPLLAIDQAKHATLEAIGNYYAPTVSWGAYTINSNGPQFAETFQDGDSGHPLFLVINGKLVLASMLWSTNSGTWLSQGTSIDVINAALTSLSTGQSTGTNYQLTTPDLSSFSQF